jgi:predicted TIM-barrel fold metal-dependent hydrolase
MERFTNIHSHFFNGKCVPDYFFKMALPKALDPFADEIKAFLEKSTIRRIIRMLSRRHGNSMLQKYLNFIEIGTQNSQLDVFKMALSSYSSFPGKIRFAGLTLNLDYMDTADSNHARIESQLLEIERARSFYPDQLFPFVSADPRHLTGVALRDWVAAKIERLGFFGIKLYPAMGYFPFHPGLDELYGWAERNQVPVISHCTRSGNYYTGKMTDVIPHNRPVSLNPGSASMQSIYSRVDRFMSNKFTRDDPGNGCNVFSNPENYIPVLEKYNKLKICLAHFGGDDELLQHDHEIVRKGIDDLPDWGTRIVMLMNEFPEVYTDISYTLVSDDALNLVKDLLDRPTGNRILFGTDFFMTVREKAEDYLWQNCMHKLGIEKFNKVAGINNDNFMKSGFYDPAIPFK